MLENELTFLVKKLPEDLGKYPKKEIRQGYYSDMPSPLRIRDEDGKLTLVKKLKIKEEDCSRFDEQSRVSTHSVQFWYNEIIINFIPKLCAKNFLQIPGPDKD